MVKRLWGIFLAVALAAAPTRAVLPTATSSITINCVTGADTVFTFPFKVLSASDLVVTRTLNGATVTLTRGPDYSVAGVGAATGTVTLTSAGRCPAGAMLKIERVVALTQPTALGQSGVFSPKVHETVFDRLTMIAQQEARERARKDAELDAKLTAGGGGGTSFTPEAFQAALASITHSAGYVPSSPDEFWILAATPDATPPVVTSFAVAETSSSYVVPVSILTATDAVGVAWYAVTESATPPAALDPAWQATPPTQATVSGTGVRYLYGHAADAAWNMATPLFASCTVTVSDTTAPTVDTFVAPATSDSLTVAITSATASDAVGVTHGVINTSGAPPAPSAPGWVPWSGSGTLPAGLASFTAASEGTFTLHLWAKDAAGNISSSPGSASVTFSATQVATPTFSPPAGTYTSDQSVAISTTTAGATIHYTIDGSTPTDASATYSTPVAVTSSKTLKAIGMKPGLSDSLVPQALYLLQAAAPTFSPVAGSYVGTQSVTVSSTTPGAAIHYTTDGSTPDAGSTLYSTPISVASTQTVKAIAVKTGYSSSAAVSAAYTISASAPTPTFVAAGTAITASGTPGKPAGMAQYDTMILAVWVPRAIALPATPAGWTQVFRTAPLALFSKRITGDPASETMPTLTLPAPGTAVVTAYRGCNASTPVNVKSSSHTTTAGTSATIPAIATTAPNTLLLAFIWSTDEVDLNPGPGFGSSPALTWLTSQIDDFDAGASASISSRIGSREVAAAGTTGTEGVTNGAQSYTGGFLVALQGG